MRRWQVAVAAQHELAAGGNEARRCNKVDECRRERVHVGGVSGVDQHDGIGGLQASERLAHNHDVHLSDPAMRRTWQAPSMNEASRRRARSQLRACCVTGRSRMGTW